FAHHLLHLRSGAYPFAGNLFGRVGARILAPARRTDYARRARTSFRVCESAAAPDSQHGVHRRKYSRWGRALRPAYPPGAVRRRSAALVGRPGSWRGQETRAGRHRQRLIAHALERFISLHSRALRAARDPRHQTIAQESDGLGRLRLARAPTLSPEQTQHGLLVATLRPVRPQLRAAAKISPVFFGFTETRLRRVSRSQTQSERRRHLALALTPPSRQCQGTRQTLAAQRYMPGGGRGLPGRETQDAFPAASRDGFTAARKILRHARSFTILCGDSRAAIPLHLFRFPSLFPPRNDRNAG